MEIRQSLALPQQQNPPPHADDLEHLQRRRRVGGAKHPDCDRTRDDGGRDQPGRRELVARAKTERQHRQRDQDEPAQHLPRPRTKLARGVEADLEEDEHGDRGEERQPLARAFLPEQRPEHGVAEERRADDERCVDADRQTRRRRESPASRCRRSGVRASSTARARGDRPVSGGRRPRARARARGAPGRAGPPPAASGAPRSAPGKLTLRSPRHLRGRRCPRPSRARPPPQLRARPEPIAGRRRPRICSAATTIRRRRGSTRSVSWKYTWSASGSLRPRRRPQRLARAVRRRQRQQAQALTEGDVGGRAELGPTRPGIEVGGSGRPRRAVRVARRGAGCSDPCVGVPPTAAEERRRYPVLAQPGTFARDPLGGIPGAGRTGVRRARPVRVVAERALGGCHAGALNPGLLALTEGADRAVA